MRNKHAGLLIFGIVIIFLLLVMSFNNTLEKIVNENCSHGISCPMQATLDTQKIISYSLISLLAAVGIFITFFLRDKPVVITDNKEKTKEESLSEKRKQKLEYLTEEEKRVVDFISKNKGSVYQSDLIKELDLSKVKVTRILDKLEGYDLTERKRRGMTNIIILK